MTRDNSSKTKGILIILSIMIIGTLIIYFQPWSYVGAPPSVNQPEGTATVFQALYVSYADGQTHWFYPKERAVALTIVGLDQIQAQMTKIQTHLFMNVHYPETKTVSSWTYTSDSRFLVYSGTGALVKDFGNNQISLQGSGLPNNEDFWLTSASSTAQDVESFVSYTMGLQYKIVIQIRNISINVNYSDGTSTHMTVLGGPQNDLEWRFIYV